MKLRRKNESDLGPIREIFRLNRGEAATWLSPNRMPDDLDSQIHGETIIVAELEGRVVGFVSLWEPDAFIHHLYVHPRHQRGGIGLALVREAARLCPGGLTLKCVRANRRAMDFYEKTGWVEVGSGQGEDGEFALLRLDNSEQAEQMTTRVRAVRLRLLHSGLWMGVFASLLVFGLHALFSDGIVGFHSSAWKGPGVESGEVFFMFLGALGLVFLFPDFRQEWKTYRNLIRLRESALEGGAEQPASRVKNREP